MPKVSEIKKTMKKQLPAELFARIDFPKAQRNLPEEVLYLIGQMDRLLTREQCLAIMEEQGCCKDEKQSRRSARSGRSTRIRPLRRGLRYLMNWRQGIKRPAG